MRTDEGCFVELPTTPSEQDGPFPICWFRFNRIPQDCVNLPPGEMMCSLRQPRCLRYLIVKLVDAEDRMGLMGDPHLETNIDLEFCGVTGWHLDAS